MNVRRALACIVGPVAVLACAASAAAHPLGNFTINHLVNVSISHNSLRVRYVLDMAEIPTFQIMRAENASGRMTARQLRSWARSEVGPIGSSLAVDLNGNRIELKGAEPSVTTRSGAGGLPTIYFVEDYRAPVQTGVDRIVLEDDTFPGRIGWKDIVVAPASDPTDELRHYPSALIGSPRNVTSATIAVTPAGLALAATSSGDDAPSAGGSSSVPLMRANALSDMLARGTSDPLVVILTLLSAVVLGALHAAEPGHGKTLLAISLVGSRATSKQALLLAVGLTAAHTAGVLLLGGLLIVAARFIVPELVYPWITLFSGVAVALLGANALARSIRNRRGLDHAHHGDHEHDFEHGVPHDHDHAPIGDKPLSFRGVMLVAMSGNIAPCPAALVVMLAALALHQAAYGIAVIVAFSVGLAALLTGLGIALVRGAAWVSRHPWFDRLAVHAPVVSACVISIIGAVILGQASAAGALDAPPTTVTACALAAIAAIALIAGNTQRHTHVHATTGALDRGVH